jgi:hypothetical protein
MAGSLEQQHHLRLIRVGLTAKTGFLWRRLPRRRHNLGFGKGGSIPPFSVHDAAVGFLCPNRYLCSLARVLRYEDVIPHG